MQLAHSGHEVLAGLLIDGDLEGGILLGDLAQYLNHLGEVAGVLGLHSHGHYRLGDVLDLLEGGHAVLGGYCGAHYSIPQAGDGGYISRRNLLYLHPLRAHHYARLLDAVGAGHSGDI